MIFVLTICQSCITPKSTIYLQADSYPMNVKSSIPFEPTIKCDNVLNILVSSESPQAAQDFNLIIASRNISSSSSAFTQLSNVTYLVDNFGFIDFDKGWKIVLDINVGFDIDRFVAFWKLANSGNIIILFYVFSASCNRH